MTVPVGDSRQQLRHIGATQTELESVEKACEAKPILGMVIAK